MDQAAATVVRSLTTTVDGWAGATPSLGVPFAERGRRLEEAIALMRRYWTEPSVTFHGRYYQAEAMAMDPKPVQAGGPPIWLGGSSEAALRRIGPLGDGWMAVAGWQFGERTETVGEKVDVIARAAEDVGRDPSTIDLQVLFSDTQDLGALAAQAAGFRAAGFTWGSVGMTQLSVAGARDVDTLREALARIKERVDRETA